MLLFTCMIFTFTIQAQDDTFNDIIELKNGSKLIGDLIFEDSAIVIFHFPTLKDTLTILQNTISFKRFNDGTRQYYRGGKYHYVARDFVRFSYAASFLDPSNQFDIGLGRRFTNSLSIGAGLGTSALHASGKPNRYFFALPHIFARKYLSENNISNKLYCSTKTGYAIPIRPTGNVIDYQGNVFIDLAIGIHYASRKDVKFSIELGILMQPVKSEFFDNQSDFFEIIVEKRIFLKNFLKINIEFF